jgi:predicted peptidase
MTVYEDPNAVITDTTEDPGLDIPSTGGAAAGVSAGSMGGESSMPDQAPVKEMVPRHTAPMEGLTRFYHPKTFIVDNRDERHTLTYFLYKPKAPKGVKWPEDAKFPLVLVLHDARGIAEAGEYLLQDSVRLSYPAYIVAPVLPEKMIWSFPSEIPDDPRLKGNLKAKQGLGDAVQLVQDLINNYPIDPRRVYVMGCAEGGFGAYGAVLNYPDVFAAAVVISGGWTVKDTPKMKGVPIWAMHGDKDKLFPPGLSMNVVGYIQQMGQRNVFWKSYPDIGRDCANQAFYPRALWPWMFQQKKK